MAKLNITQFSKGAAKFLISRASAKDMTMLDIARVVDCHPSLLTWVKQGHVPTRSTCELIGKALGDRDGFLIACGYIPSLNWDPSKSAESKVKSQIRDVAKRLRKAKLDLANELEALYG